MITAKKILFLIESWFNSRDVRGTYISIYKNPTVSDWAEMVKTARKENRELSRIRVIANFITKEVFVSDGYISTHGDMRTILNLRTGPSVACYMADYKNGAVDAVNFWPGHDETLNWKFADKYVKNSSIVLSI